jgi:hypothetical protein
MGLVLSVVELTLTEMWGFFVFQKNYKVVISGGL